MNSIHEKLLEQARDMQGKEHIEPSNAQQGSKYFKGDCIGIAKCEAEFTVAKYKRDAEGNIVVNKKGEPEFEYKRSEWRKLNTRIFLYSDEPTHMHIINNSGVNDEGETQYVLVRMCAHVFEPKDEDELILGVTQTK